MLCVCISRSAFSPPSWLTNPSPSTIDFGFITIICLWQTPKPFVFLLPFVVKIKSHDPTWQSFWTDQQNEMNVQMNVGPTVLAWFSNIVIDYWLLAFSSIKVNISIRSAGVTAGPKVWYLKSTFLFQKTNQGAWYWNPLLINHYIQIAFIHGNKNLYEFILRVWGLWGGGVVITFGQYWQYLKTSACSCLRRTWGLHGLHSPSEIWVFPRNNQQQQHKFRSLMSTCLESSLWTWLVSKICKTEHGFQIFEVRTWWCHLQFILASSVENSVLCQTIMSW